MSGPITRKRILGAVAAVGLVGSLSGCAVYPSYPAYAYGYGPGYAAGGYAPAYVYRPAPVVVSPGWGWGRGWHRGWRGW